MKDTLDRDLKAAMLARETQRVSVLRSLKSAITYAEVAAGARQQGLDDAAVLEVFAKEAKKRQDSADSYTQAGSPERAAAELAEKAIIDAYLPRMLSEVELSQLIDQAVAGLDDITPKQMGQVIAAVKAQAATRGRVDGSLLARLTKDRLSQ